MLHTAWRIPHAFPMVHLALLMTVSNFFHLNQCNRFLSIGMQRPGRWECLDIVDRMSGQVSSGRDVVRIFVSLPTHVLRVEVS